MAISKAVIFLLFLPLSCLAADGVSVNALSPQVTLTKYNGELTFTLKPSKLVVYPSAVVNGSTYTWSNLQGKTIISIKPDSFDFDVVFNTEPATNLISFSITNYQFLNVYYQPPLWQTEGLHGPVAGCTDTDCDSPVFGKEHRDANVVGSYALYYTKSGNQYGSGKIGHIYRPFITDAKGTNVWCDLNYDGVGNFVVTIPQTFLDSAVYPVTLDPTLGYTTCGGSNSTSTSDNADATKGAAIENGTVTSLSVCIDGNGVGTVSFKGVLWLGDSPWSVVTNGIAGTVTLPASAGGTFTTINYSPSPSITASTNYLIGGIGNGTFRYYYDDGVGPGSCLNGPNSFTSPTANSSCSGSTRSMSAYVTYTTGGGGAPPPDAKKRVIFTGDE